MSVVFERLKNSIPEIEARMNYAFSNKSLLINAFTHRSFINENRHLASEHNERLEFLGDSVLGLIVSDYLYHQFPSSREGNLSHLRACVVDAPSCMHYLQKLQLSEFALMGRGEMLNEGRGRDSILADLFEALLGAIYLDGGLDAAHGFVMQYFEEDIKKWVMEPQKNWKAILQDYSQKKYQKPPVYEVIKEEGPDHLKTFTIAVKIQDEKVGEGSGLSKKEAQQNAAEDAAKSLGLE